MRVCQACGAGRRGGGRTAAAAVGELMPSELYHQGGMRIYIYIYIYELIDANDNHDARKIIA